MFFNGKRYFHNQLVQTEKNRDYGDPRPKPKKKPKKKTIKQDIDLKKLKSMFGNDVIIQLLLKLFGQKEKKEKEPKKDRKVKGMRRATGGGGFQSKTSLGAERKRREAEIKRQSATAKIGQLITDTAKEGESQDDFKKRQLKELFTEVSKFSADDAGGIGGSLGAFALASLNSQGGTNFPSGTPDEFKITIGRLSKIRKDLSREDISPEQREGLEKSALDIVSSIGLNVSDYYLTKSKDKKVAVGVEKQEGISKGILGEDILGGLGGSSEGGGGAVLKGSAEDKAQKAEAKRLKAEQLKISQEKASKTAGSFAPGGKFASMSFLDVVSQPAAPKAPKAPEPPAVDTSVELEQTPKPKPLPKPPKKAGGRGQATTRDGFLQKAREKITGFTDGIGDSEFDDLFKQQLEQVFSDFEGLEDFTRQTQKLKKLDTIKNKYDDRKLDEPKVKETSQFRLGEGDEYRHAGTKIGQGRGKIINKKTGEIIDFTTNSTLKRLEEEISATQGSAKKELQRDWARTFADFGNAWKSAQKAKEGEEATLEYIPAGFGLDDDNFLEEDVIEKQGLQLKIDEIDSLDKFGVALNKKLLPGKSLQFQPGETVAGIGVKGISLLTPDGQLRFVEHDKLSVSAENRLSEEDKRKREKYNKLSSTNPARSRKLEEQKLLLETARLTQEQEELQGADPTTQKLTGIRQVRRGSVELKPGSVILRKDEPFTPEIGIASYIAEAKQQEQDLNDGGPTIEEITSSDEEDFPDLETSSKAASELIGDGTSEVGSEEIEAAPEPAQDTGPQRIDIDEEIAEAEAEQARADFKAKEDELQRQIEEDERETAEAKRLSLETTAQSFKAVNIKTISGKTPVEQKFSADIQVEIKEVGSDEEGSVEIEPPPSVEIEPAQEEEDRLAREREERDRPIKEFSEALEARFPDASRQELKKYKDARSDMVATEERIRRREQAKADGDSFIRDKDAEEVYREAEKLLDDAGVLPENLRGKYLEETASSTSSGGGDLEIKAAAEPKPDKPPSPEPDAPAVPAAPPSIGESVEIDLPEAKESIESPSDILEETLASLDDIPDEFKDKKKPRFKYALVKLEENFDMYRRATDEFKGIMLESLIDSDLFAGKAVAGNKQLSKSKKESTDKKFGKEIIKVGEDNSRRLKLLQETEIQKQAEKTLVEQRTREAEQEQAKIEAAQVGRKSSLAQIDPQAGPPSAPPTPQETGKTVSAFKPPLPTKKLTKLQELKKKQSQKTPEQLKKEKEAVLQAQAIAAFDKKKEDTGSAFNQGGYEDQFDLLESIAGGFQGLESSTQLEGQRKKQSGKTDTEIEQLKLLYKKEKAKGRTDTDIFRDDAFLISQRDLSITGGGELYGGAAGEGQLLGLETLNPPGSKLISLIKGEAESFDLPDPEKEPSEIDLELASLDTIRTYTEKGEKKIALGGAGKKSLESLESKRKELLKELGDKPTQGKKQLHYAKVLSIFKEAQSTADTQRAEFWKDYLLNYEQELREGEGEGFTELEIQENLATTEQKLQEQDLDFEAKEVQDIRVKLLENKARLAIVKESRKEAGRTEEGEALQREAEQLERQIQGRRKTDSFRDFDRVEYHTSPGSKDYMDTQRRFFRGGTSVEQQLSRTIRSPINIQETGRGALVRLADKEGKTLLQQQRDTERESSRLIGEAPRLPPPRLVPAERGVGLAIQYAEQPTFIEQSNIQIEASKKDRKQKSDAAEIQSGQELQQFIETEEPRRLGELQLASGQGLLALQDKPFDGETQFQSQIGNKPPSDLDLREEDDDPFGSEEAFAALD
tara:strand:+ start:8815 stop:14187 length:5373 start_codon:yes stop_codon:yes gene_type:complete